MTARAVLLAIVSARIVFAAPTLGAVPRELPDKWRSCERDADCVVGSVYCDISIINRKYSKEFEVWWNLRHQADRCAAVRAKEEIVTQCRDGKCVMRAEKKPEPD